MVLKADSIGWPLPPGSPQVAIPLGTTPTRAYTGQTPTALWSAAFVASPNGMGGNYYIAFEPYTGTITSFTAKFIFVIDSPENSANFDVPETSTWYSHISETITVPITQSGLTETVASIGLPAGLPPPQITFLDITTSQPQAVPEPASVWMIALGISGISVIFCTRR